MPALYKTFLNQPDVTGCNERFGFYFYEPSPHAVKIVTVGGRWQKLTVIRLQSFLLNWYSCGLSSLPCTLASAQSNIGAAISPCLLISSIFPSRCLKNSGLIVMRPVPSKATCPILLFSQPRHRVVTNWITL